MKEMLEIIGVFLIYGIAILAIVGIPVLTVKLVYWICRDKKNTTPPEEKEIDIENGKAETTEEYLYIKPYLLTKKEWAFYKALKPITDKYHLHILAKVRLADLVEVKKGLSNSQVF